MNENQNLLILEMPRHLAGLAYRPYRGTDRPHPTYVESCPDDSPVNKLFMWFIEAGGESGIVHDFATAHFYCQHLNYVAGGARFELVELADSEPTNSAELLGFDLSWDGVSTSLLSEGLVPMPAIQQLGEAASARCAAVDTHYRSLLNPNGLFGSRDAAVDCLREKFDLQRAYPLLYEGGDFARFRVIGIFLPNGMSR